MHHSVLLSEPGFHILTVITFSLETSLSNESSMLKFALLNILIFYALNKSLSSKGTTNLSDLPKLCSSGFVKVNKSP